MKPLLSLAGLLFAFTATTQAQPPAPLKVHLVGAGEYNPVESFTVYKKYLEGCGAVVTTSFGKTGKALPDLERLKDADVMVLFVRRMDLPDDQIALIRDHWDKGRPIVALRTASHGFQPADNETFSKVLGGAYQGPGSYTAPFKAIPNEAQKDHPVLTGVGPIASRGCYRFGPLADKAVVLQFEESARKVKSPATWAHEFKGGRVVYTTMGSPEDFLVEDFRRLLANAIFWSAHRDPVKLRPPTISQ